MKDVSAIIRAGDFSLLIVRLSSIGDVVHVMPSLVVLRRRFPSATIGWAVSPPADQLLKDRRDIDHVHVIERDVRAPGSIARFLEAFRQMRSVRYDMAIDFQGLAKSGIVARLSGARARIGYAGEDARELNRLFSNLRVEPGDRKHVIERNAALLAPLGVELEKGELEFGIAESDEAGAAADKVLADAGLEEGEFCILNAGAGWATKRWPEKHYGRLGELIAETSGRRSLVVWWGRMEHAAARKIVACSDGACVLAPHTALTQLAALARKCSLFVGSDTGPVHVAAAVGASTLGLYGPSDPVRNGPRGKRTAWVTSELPCLGCWSVTCPLKGGDRHSCMRSLEPERVAAAAAELTPGD